MTPIAQMIIEMIESGDMDSALPQISAAINGRMNSLQPVSAPSPSVFTPRPPKKFKKLDPVVVVKYRPLSGVIGHIRQESTGPGRWIVEVSPAHRKKAEPFLMTRYPNCISVPEQYLQKR